MALSDSGLGHPGIDRLPAERGYVLAGAGSLGEAERLFGARLTIGQAHRLAWEAGAPEALVIPVAATRVEIRIADREPWVSRWHAWLAGHRAATAFGDQLARAISKLEAWQESEADGAASPEELAVELTRLRQLAPSVESERAIVEALEALDDGLPADAVAAALYRAGVTSR